MSFTFDLIKLKDASNWGENNTSNLAVPYVHADPG